MVLWILTTNVSIFFTFTSKFINNNSTLIIFCISTTHPQNHAPSFKQANSGIDLVLENLILQHNDEQLQQWRWMMR